MHKHKKPGVKPGTRFSEQHRRNMSLARMGKQHSQETKDKIAASLRRVLSQKQQ